MQNETIDQFVARVTGLDWRFEKPTDLPAALGHIAALQALCKRAAGELMLVKNHAAFNEISDELVRDLANGGNGCQ